MFNNQFLTLETQLISGLRLLDSQTHVVAYQLDGSMASYVILSWLEVGTPKFPTHLPSPSVQYQLPKTTIFNLRVIITYNSFKQTIQP